jgi:PST family polysaccharide transporter
MAASGDSTPAIREKIVSGGIYMAGRWGIGTAVSLIGTVAITRAVGPSQYGVFAAVLAIFMYVSNIGSFGLDVYLIRLQAVSIPRRTIDTAFWLTSGLAVVLGAGGALLALVGPNVVNGANWTVTALLGSAAFTFSLISNIPLALLEKELDFRRVAAVELTNQYLFYAVAVPGAILFKAAWAPAAGLVIQQAVAVVAFSAAASYRPHFAWSTAVARDGLKYGLSMTGAQSIYQLRQLVNPLIIGATLGAAATGYVALAIRMIETLSFVRSVTWRLAIAAFSKIRADLPKTRRAIGEGMPLQVLALGSFLLPLCWVSTFVVPIVFGPQWRPSIGLLPYIAVGYLVNMAFSTNSAALFVAARNRDVAVFHTFHVALFAGAAYVFAHVYGLRGYGYAELAGLGAYPYLAWRTDRAFGGSPGLSLAMIWLASFCVAMFVHVVGWWSAAALAPVVLWPRSWATASIVVTPMMALIPRPWAPRGSSRRRRPVQYAARWRGQWVSPAWCSLYVLLFVGMVLSSAASPRFFAENTAAANATLISPSFDGRILECTLGGLVLLCVIAVGAGRLYRSDARHWVVIGVASIGPALGGIFGPMPDKHFQYLGLLLVGAVILLLPRLSLAAYARVVRGVLLLVVGAEWLHARLSAAATVARRSARRQ